VSLPAPPTIESLPAPPDSESSPAPPISVSLPVPPFNESLPSPPFRASAPAAPVMLLYSNLVKSAGFVKSIYPNNKRLYAVSSTAKGIFYRWAEITQTNKIFHTAFEKAANLYQYRQLFKVFYAIRTHMRSLNTVEMRRQDTPFVVKRLYCDLLQISKRFTSKRKKSTHSLTTYSLTHSLT
jgi:hypothetical protein